MDEQKRNQFREEDLERYGVWVKAGPEEVVDADDDFAFADLPAEATPDLDRPKSPSDDDNDLVSLDDLDLEEPDGETDPFSVLGEDELSPDVPEDDSATPEFGELSLSDDFDEPNLPDGPEELSLPDDFGEFDEPEDAPSFEDGTAPESPAGDDDTDDFDLDELTNSLDDDFDDIELETPEDDDSEPESDDGVFDSTIPGSDDELEDIHFEDFTSEDADGEDLPELTVEDEHDFTPEDQGIEIVPEEWTNQITPDEEEFLAAEEDLQNGGESAIPRTMDTQEREAFDRIQTELTDIKRELAELKQALRDGAASQPQYRDEPASSAAPVPPDDYSPDSDAETPPETAGEIDFGDDDFTDEPFESTDTESPASGFFEEDEDETIALTGDELDNILNTAEFTELAGEAEEIDDDFLVDSEEDNAEESAEAPKDAEESFSQPVSEIEMEPVDDTNEIEAQADDDDPAVNELADMDIDQELSDIESLSDDSSDQDVSEPDEIEIDLDALDEIDEPDFETPTGDEPDEGEDFDSFASAVEQDIAGAPSIDDSTDTTEDSEAPGTDDTGDIDEIELDDDFEDESGPEESEEPVDETPEEDDEEIELDLDDLDVEDFNFEEESFDSGEDQDSIGTDATETAEPADMEEPPTTVETTEPTESAADAEEQEPPAPAHRSATIAELPEDLKQEIRSVLSYMDQLLEALPDDKIEEFAQSEHFDVYKRLFEELGLDT